MHAIFPPHLNKPPNSWSTDAIKYLLSLLRHLVCTRLGHWPYCLKGLPKCRSVIRAIWVSLFQFPTMTQFFSFISYFIFDSNDENGWKCWIKNLSRLAPFPVSLILVYWSTESVSSICVWFYTYFVLAWCARGVGNSGNANYGENESRSIRMW